MNITSFLTDGTYDRNNYLLEKANRIFIILLFLNCVTPISCSLSFRVTDNITIGSQDQNRKGKDKEQEIGVTVRKKRK